MSKQSMSSNAMARAIANIVIFFEFCSNDVLDDDVAIQMMEQLAGDLHALDDRSRRELSAAFRDIACSYQGDTREFVETLPDALGLE